METSVITYKLAVMIPQQVSIPGVAGKNVYREGFYQWVWNRFSQSGLLGVHEGTVLSEQAAEEGMETESWTVDAAEAPKERDWVDRQEEVRAELYFAECSQALLAAKLLKQIPEITVGHVEELESQDWDAEWKAAFLNSEKGIKVEPFWHIVPPWVEVEQDVGDSSSLRYMKINPGAGFGTGSHETTQLCLEAIGKLSSQFPLKGARALDFGAGSGILSVGMALLGAQVDAVEIDLMAIDNAVENVERNGVSGLVSVSQHLPAVLSQYDCVVANILRPILLEYAEQIVQRLKPRGVLILSGLIEKDIELIFNEYSRRMNRTEARVMELKEWRALVFSEQLH